ncbi:MAG: glycosyltransferase family 1 protein [Rickettsiella sp.]|nr:glycosyltransferase family 1 protein [Rickettsiella sp.]
MYGLKHPLTGIGWYIHHLIRELAKHNAIKQLISIPRSDYDVTYEKKSFQSIIKKLIQCYSGSYDFLHNYYNFSFYKRNKYFSSENFIYHEPCYILRPYSGLKICSVHDLSHIYHPGLHPKGRVNFLLRYLPRSLSDADHIITGSHAVCNELRNYFKIPSKKITVIYHGVSTVFKKRQLLEVNPVLTRYGLSGKTYILSVGTLEPRKNLERLVQAFKQLPEHQRKQFPLVLVGLPGWGIGRLWKLIKQLINKEELYCLGYVASGDLPFLYSGAYGFVYLSLYEGFGLPLLEALASAIPTLSSNTSSMSEVVGGIALLVNPLDVGAITDKLNQLLTDNFLREKLKYQGPIQAAQFTWKKSVNKTVKVYQQVIACSS